MSSSSAPTTTHSIPESYTALTGAVLTAVVTLGTLYSVLYGTALDTSNPLSSLPTTASLTSSPGTITTYPSHPHSSAYLAQKSNIFNVIFVKKAWGWTSAAFFALFLTSPPHLLRPTRRLARWGASSLVWVLFVAWFFGPSLFDRLNALSGAECLVRLDVPEPVTDTSSPGSASTWVVVPHEYCHAGTHLTPGSHPSFFSSNPDLAKALASSSLAGGSHVIEAMKLRPKLYKGHDVSGHLFLLTLSVLFLVDQLTPSVKLLLRTQWRSASGNANGGTTTAEEEVLGEEKKDASAPSLELHSYAVAFGLGLTALWIVMALTTSVYFHTVLEKVTGFAAGLLGYWATTIVAP